MVVKSTKKLKEETLRLIELAQQGDIEARNKAVLENLGLVANQIKHISYSKSNFSDLKNVGALALIEAVMKYDRTKNVEFSYYASKLINYSFLNYFKSNRQNADVLDINGSLDNENDGAQLIEVISDNSTQTEEIVETKIICGIVNETVSKQLKKRESEIMQMYFGLNGYKKMNIVEIGENYGISHQRVSQIIKNSLAKTREKLEKKGISYKF